MPNIQETNRNTLQKYCHVLKLCH